MYMIYPILYRIQAVVKRYARTVNKKHTVVIVVGLNIVSTKGGRQYVKKTGSNVS